MWLWLEIQRPYEIQTSYDGEEPKNTVINFADKPLPWKRYRGNDRTCGRTMAIACPLPVLNTNAFPTTARGRFFNRTSSSNESRRFNLSFRNGRLAHRPTCTISPRAFTGPGQGQKPYTSVMIVPTGVGASIGGFAGDALPVARATASIVDCLISHPNVLNAAMLYWPMSNVLYVEGYALDRFAEGLWGLQPVHQNKVGLVLDAGMEEELRLRHLQVADAARASLGLSVVQCVVTDTTLQVEKWVDAKTGQSTGRLGHPDSLLRAVDTLVNRANVNAVAIVGRFPDDSLDELEDYRQGKGIDVLAGVEAIISHLVVQEFHIPCAHAPALLPLPSDPLLSPRSAAEEIGYTFLPCVLAGLSRAPQYVVRKVEYPLGISRQGCIWAGDVDSVIVPFDACGGAGILAFGCKEGSKPLIIAVEENETVLNDTPDKLALDVVKVANYWEALGVIAAHKSGVDPQSLRRHGVNRIQCSPSVPRQESFVNSKLQVSPTIAQITSGISPDSADGNIYYDGHRTNCIQTRYKWHWLLHMTRNDATRV